MKILDHQEERRDRQEPVHEREPRVAKRVRHQHRVPTGGPEVGRVVERGAKPGQLGKEIRVDVRESREARRLTRRRGQGGRAVLAVAGPSHEVADERERRRAGRSVSERPQHRDLGGGASETAQHLAEEPRLARPCLSEHERDAGTPLGDDLLAHSVERGNLARASDERLAALGHPASAQQERHETPARLELVLVSEMRRRHGVDEHAATRCLLEGQANRFLDRGRGGDRRIASAGEDPDAQRALTSAEREGASCRTMGAVGGRVGGERGDEGVVPATEHLAPQRGDERVEAVRKAQPAGRANEQAAVGAHRAAGDDRTADERRR